MKQKSGKVVQELLEIKGKKKYERKEITSFPLHKISPYHFVGSRLILLQIYFNMLHPQT